MTQQIEYYLEVKDKSGNIVQLVPSLNPFSQAAVAAAAYDAATGAYDYTARTYQKLVDVPTGQQTGVMTQEQYVVASAQATKIEQAKAANPPPPAAPPVDVAGSGGNTTPVNTGDPWQTGNGGGGENQPPGWSYVQGTGLLDLSDPWGGSQSAMMNYAPSYVTAGYTEIAFSTSGWETSGGWAYNVFYAAGPAEAVSYSTGNSAWDNP